MDEQVLDNNTDSLFEGEGKINEDDLQKLKIELAGYKLPGKSREAFGTLQKCSFSIGKPVFPSFQEFLELSGQPSLSKIRSRMKDYEFCPVELTCSFKATGGYRFHDACFKVALQTLPANANATSSAVQEQAMAYSLFPLRSEDEINSTTTEGGPLMIGGSVVSITIPSPQISRSGVEHRSFIDASHLKTTQPEWQFTRTQFREIRGPYPLLMLVQKSRGTKAQATFSLTAHLEFVVGPTPLKTLLSVVMHFRRSALSATITDHPTTPLC